MAETSVRPCTCQHDYQDGKYGVGRRVKNKNTTGWSCTVCDTQDTPGATVKKKKK